MTVYVDDLTQVVGSLSPRLRKMGRSWCHMATDDNYDELHAMAERVGLKRSYFQHRHSIPHYDLTPKMRERAVLLGAVSVSGRVLADRCSVTVMGASQESVGVLYDIVSTNLLYKPWSKHKCATVYTLADRVIVVLAEQRGTTRFERALLEFPSEEAYLSWRKDGGGRKLEDKRPNDSTAK